MPKTPRNNFYPELPRGGTRNAVSGIVDVPGYHSLAVAGHRSAYAGFAHRRNGAITPSKRVFANGYYTSETGIRILFAFASAILFERATLKRNPQIGHCQRVAVRDEYNTDSKNRTNNIEQRQNSRVFSACYAGLINYTNRIVGTHRIGGR